VQNILFNICQSLFNAYRKVTCLFFISENISHSRQLGRKRRKRNIEQQRYLCSICSKAFSQKSALVNHMRIHTGEKPYVCEYCEKKFSDATTRKRHLRTHTGETP